MRETENRINRNKKTSVAEDKNYEKQLNIKELRNKCSITKYDAEMIIAQNTCQEKHKITTRSSKRAYHEESISNENHSYSIRKVKTYSAHHCDQNERTELGKFNNFCNYIFLKYIDFRFCFFLF